MSRSSRTGVRPTLPGGPAETRDQPRGEAAGGDVRGLRPACGSPAWPGAHGPRRLCLHRGTGRLLCPAPGPARRNRGRKRKTPRAFLVLQRAHHASQHVTSPGPATGPGYQPPGCPGQRPPCSRAPRVPNNPLGTSESRRRRQPASREAALFPGSGSWENQPRARARSAPPPPPPRAPGSRLPSLDARGAPGARQPASERPVCGVLAGGRAGAPLHPPGLPRSPAQGLRVCPPGGVSPIRLLVAGLGLPRMFRAEIT